MAAPTYTRTEGFLASLFRYLFPDRATSPVRFFGQLVKTLAGAVTDLHAAVEAQAREVMPDTAEGDGRVRWGRMLGVPQKAATGAHRLAALRVTGSAGSAVTAGDELHDPNTGLRYQVDETTTIPLVAPFHVDVAIAAIDTGAATRLPSGTILEFTSPPAGLATEAELQLDLEGGGDLEQTGAHRDRILTRLGDPPLGGSPTDFELWAKSLAWVSAAYAYPNRAGRGSVDVVVLLDGTGADRVPSSPQRTEALDALRELVPYALAGTTGDLRVLTPVPETVDVELLITANGEAEHEFDWDDSAGPAVGSWNGTTRTLTLAADRPASMKAGDRILIKDLAGLGDGAEVVIEALGAGADDLILEASPVDQDGADLAPVAGDLVYSGGPLVGPIRKAVLAHLNGELVYAGARGVPLVASEAGSTVRLQVLAQPVGTANPGRIYGAWSGTLHLAILSSIAAYKRGVANVEVLAPPADVDAPEYSIPDDHQVGLLVPGRVLVRQA